MTEHAGAWVLPANVEWAIGVESEPHANWAVCSCGWHGPERMFRESATGDAVTHFDKHEGTG